MNQRRHSTPHAGSPVGEAGFPKIDVRSRAVEKVRIAGAVHVRYRRTDSIDESALSADVALLSDDERARHGRMAAKRDRDEYAAAHALLRTTLSELGDRAPDDWRFAAGPHGKPALVDSASRLSFNLSHARGLVACAVVEDADVGLDVEQVTRPTAWPGIAARYFSRAELAEIDRVEPARQAIRFFELWTLKEAFVKALGVGLSQPLNAISFSAERPDAIAFQSPSGVAAAVWQFALYAPTPEHRLAVAVSDGTTRRWRMIVRDDLH
jgi:4'-phosphopantetheinyl transferase